MATLEIRVFGTLTLERDGRPLAKFPSKRVGELLGFLVLNRDTLHSREYLAGLIWGELDDRRARHSLNTALWRLHRTLAPAGRRHAPYLRVDSRYIGFNPDSDVRLDLEEFERHIQWAEQISEGFSERQAQLYRHAVTLYRGQLLSECYEDWCIIERERLQNMYLRALAHLFDYYSDSGDHDRAAEQAQLILSLDPLREEVHRDLIDLYLAAGQQALALRQYRACEEILARELGIEPMAETRERLSQLLELTELSRSPDRPGVISLPANRPHSESDPDLSSSLERLHDSLAQFDSAYLDLLDAITNVTSAARRLEDAVPGGELRTPDERESAVEQVRSAARVVELAARYFRGAAPGRDRSNTL